MSKVTVGLGCELLKEDLDILNQYCDIKQMPWTNHERAATLSEDEIIEAYKNCDIAYFYVEPVTRRVIEELKANGLKLIGCGRGTPVNIDWQAAADNDLKIVYTPARNAHSVAEYTVGLLLALAKRIPMTYHALKNKEYLAGPKDDPLNVEVQDDVIWLFRDGRPNPRSSFPKGIDVFGRTVGILGLGGIGQIVAKSLIGIGMNVIAYDPYQKDEVFEKLGVKRYDDMLKMLPECDFVSVHLAVTDETRGSLSDDFFNAMKKGTYFINTARAAVIDQKALVNALNNGQVGFAAVDVMWEEPAPENHPFFSMDNVIVTPHFAGVSSDVKKWSSVMARDEIMHFVNNEPNELVWKRLK